MHASVRSGVRTYCRCGNCPPQPFLYSDSFWIRTNVPAQHNLPHDGRGTTTYQSSTCILCVLNPSGNRRKAKKKAPSCGDTRQCLRTPGRDGQQPEGWAQFKIATTKFWLLVLYRSTTGLQESHVALVVDAGTTRGINHYSRRWPLHRSDSSSEEHERVYLWWLTFMLHGRQIMDDMPSSTYSPRSCG